MKKIAFLIIIALFPVSLYSQVETHYYQKGDTIHNEFRKIKGLGNNNVVKMPEFDLKELIEEDQRMENENLPYRFGKPFNVSYSLKDGAWTDIDNGRLWTLSFSSEGALSLNFVFDDFHLPEGAELYIENQKGTVLYGPVTTKDIPKSGFFLTDIIPGSQVKIYIFEPSDVKETSTLTIRRVVHGYRGNLTSDPYGNVGGSASCHIDVACEPSYAEESNAVALVLLSGGNYLCSGSLQMSTDLSFKPYFLTAFHCADSDINKVLSDSEISKAEAWMFKFFFKKTTCGGADYTGTTYNSATFRAAYAFTDFLLMEINHNLKQNTSLTWLGWDKSGSVPTSGVCIQHPAGDLMKIATSDNSAITSSINGYSNNGWRMRWNSDGGVTQGGSSGSPLLNQNKKVVGQVYGKKVEDINESTEICGRKNTHFGKFSLSWTGGGHTYDRLSNWLDPINSGKTTINSSHPLYISGPNIVCSSSVYYVENLSSNSDYSVTWSFKNASSLNSLIQQNSPSTNMCTINASSITFDPTLVATIWYGSTVLCSVEKELMRPKSLTGTIHQEGQYYNGRTYPSFTIDMDPIFAVNQVCQITLQSPKFKHMNFSTTTNPNTAVNLQRIDDETIQFSVSYQASDVDLRIYGTGNGSCNDFQLRVLAMKNPIDPSNPFYVNMSDNTIELGLNQAMMRNWTDDNSDADNSTQQPWMLNVYDATSAIKVYSKQVEGNRLNIDASGWSAGIYIIYAVIKGKTYSTKVTVK